VAATVLLLTLRGTPFLYAGEELGLLDAVVPEDRVVDPGGRDGCRAPFPWTSADDHGWGPDPWLPFPPDASARSLAAIRDDPTSILHLYREGLALRRATPALHRGNLELLDPPDGVVGFDRIDGDERWRVLVNFTSDQVPIGDLMTGRPIALTSGAGTLRPAIAALLPDEAVVLGPA
jgi:alpha-glucosidase